MSINFATTRKFAVAGICALAVVGFGVALPQTALAQDKEVIMATGPVAGTNYPVGGAFCRTINKVRPRIGLRCLIESTSGSSENLARLAGGDVDLAILQSDWQYHAPARLAAAQQNSASEDETTTPQLRALLSLHAQPFTLVAGPDSGITMIADLDGKSVDLGLKDSAVRAAALTFLEALGWSPTDWETAPGLPPGELAKALCAGDIDAFLLPISHPNGLVAAVTERCQAKLISISGEAADHLIESWPFYTRVEIPGGVYSANADPVNSFGLRATVVAREDLSADVVYDLLRVLFEDRGGFASQHGALASIALDRRALEGNSLPFHDGAQRLYRERGWLEAESQ